MRILHDIIYEPSYVKRHPVHITTFKGKSAVFQAENNYIGSKKMIFFDTSFSTDDFSFKIGGNSDNAHHSSWETIVALNFSQFKNVAINKEEFIRIEYTGSTTKADIIAYVDCPITEEPTTISLVKGYINGAGANDILFWTGLKQTYPSLSYQLGTANVYTAKRTAQEITDSSLPLAIFQAGITSGNTTQSVPTDSNPSHFYFEKTNTNSNLNYTLSVNQTQNSTIQIGNAATPIRNFGYPFTDDGTNSNCIDFDRINDFCEVINLADRQALDFNLIPNNSWICIKATVVYTVGFGSWRIISLGSLNNSRITFGLSLLGSGIFLYTQLGTYKAISFPCTLIPNIPYTIQVFVKKINNTGTATNTFDVANSFAIVHRRVITGVVTNNTVSHTLPVITTIPTHKMRLGQDTDWNPDDVNNSSKFAIKKLLNVGFSVQPTLEIEDLEEMIHYALNPVVAIEYMQRAWDFRSVVNTNEIAQVGTTGTGNARLVNHNTNSTSNLIE